MEIKISDLLEAAKKNGYPWDKDNRFNDNGRISYCVLEQTALNLGLKAGHWGEIVNQVNTITRHAGEDIWGYNDSNATSYQDAYQYMSKRLEAYKDKSIIIDEEIITEDEPE